MKPIRNPMKRQQPDPPKRKAKPAGPACPFCAGQLESSSTALEGEIVLLCKPCRKTALKGSRLWKSLDDEDVIAQLKHVAESRRLFNEILYGGWDQRWTRIE